MSPRIAIPDGARDAHGALDHKVLESIAVRPFRERFDGLVKSIQLVDPATIEIVRLENANHQRCRL